MVQPKTNRGKRKFFRFSIDLGRSDRPAFKCVNSATIRKVEPKYDSRRRGFPEYPETPRFLFDRRLGLPVRDAEASELGWLISDRAKAVFDKLDAPAFIYLPVETVLADGSAGPAHWLCDLARVLDCIDDERSSLGQSKRPDGEKFYDINSTIRIVLREDEVSDACVFRPRYFEAITLCDNHFRSAWRDAKLKGFSFYYLDAPFTTVK